MTPLNAHQPSKVYRGTIDEVLNHRNEIPPGATVELKVFEEGEGVDEPETALPDPRNAASIALLKSWIAQAPTDPEEIRKAEKELNEFKRNMNANRAATGERLPYPDVAE